jgi:23S rRNA (uracil747-C5)-methyltransferase
MASFCPYFNQSQCRSCDLIETDYSGQISWKEELLRTAFPGVALEPSVTSSQQAFRNRAKMAVTGTVEAPVIGLTGEADLDQGRELLHCPIHHPKLNELIAAMPEFIRSYHLYPYSIEARKGELKGLIAFYSPRSGQMYLRFILRSKDCVSRIIKMLPSLQARFPELVCVSANLQPIPHAILEGKEEIILTEKKFIDDDLEKVRLKLAPQAFVQTNVEIATKLYQTAARWIAESASKRLLELFCGQGAFSFFAASFLAEGLGIEINADAVNSANETAHEQGFSHLRFKCADATRVQAEMDAFQPEIVLVNPPRRGLSEGVALLLKNRPPHLIYSSCSIETLSTDVQKLSSSYRVERVQLFDMFPHTKHFETLVWLVRI